MVSSINDDEILLGNPVQIQWFPGHMTKTRRLIESNLKLVDLVAEIIDARIPESSRNPLIDEILKDKRRMIILNKADLADENLSKKWCGFFESKGIKAVLTESTSGKGINNFYSTVKLILKDKIERDKQRGMKKPIKMMIVGIPNVGKSSFINRIAGDKRAKVEDRPGVTRGKQWIRLQNGIELLDTPGILWPKFEDEKVGLNLAFTGAVKDDITDIELVASKLCLVLADLIPEAFCVRYKLKSIDEIKVSEPLKVIGRKRGFLISGGEIDTERAARIFLDEFRGGKLGRVTLEKPAEDSV